MPQTKKPTKTAKTRPTSKPKTKGAARSKTSNARPLKPAKTSKATGMILPPKPPPAASPVNHWEPSANWDKSWHDTFLELFSESLNVKLSCEGAGIGRATLYRHLQEDAEFAEDFEHARLFAMRKLEAACFKRAHEGMSDRLAIFLLQHHDERYRKQRFIILTEEMLKHLDDEAMADLRAGRRVEFHLLNLAKAIKRA